MDRKQAPIMLTQKDRQTLIRNFHAAMYQVHSNPAKCGSHSQCKGCGDVHPCPGRN